MSSPSPNPIADLCDDNDFPGLGPDYDRPIPEVAAPPLAPLTVAQLFDGKKIRLEVLKDHLIREGRLAEDCITKLVSMAKKILRDEPNMLTLHYPITVCGDVHGQFFDLVRLFSIGGDPAETQYLFLGDYVDRGNFSSECVFYLLALKITYRTTFFMLRGNHECRQLTAFFNFRDECTYKYNLPVYDLIMDCFDHLPIAAILNNDFFCVHGGLSPDINSISEIRSLERFQEIPKEGPLCDLLWSDPYEVDGADESDADDDPTLDHLGFKVNETRHCSYHYGLPAVRRFLDENNLTSVIRAHEAQMDGYKMQMLNRRIGIPRVITIFSAPNYCDCYGNKAACLKFDRNVLNIKQFQDSAHPYYLPNFMDVFQWSIPFVADKVVDMLTHVLETDLDEGSDSDSGAPMDRKAKEHCELIKQRGLSIRKKVLTMARWVRIFKLLRDNNSEIVRLKELSPEHKIPSGIVEEGPEAIQTAIRRFKAARKKDSKNEARPS